MNETIVGCDEIGVWREDMPGARSQLPWDEITRIAGYKLDCITQVDTVIELDHESGHYLEINDAWRGFDDVVRGLGERFQALAADWFDRITNLKTGDAALVVWQRDDFE